MYLIVTTAPIAQRTHLLLSNVMTAGDSESTAEQGTSVGGHERPPTRCQRLRREGEREGKGKGKGKGWETRGRGGGLVQVFSRQYHVWFVVRVRVWSRNSKWQGLAMF